MTEPASRPVEPTSAKEPPSSVLRPPSPVGVLLMSFGTPERLEEVADYYTRIRGGQRPSDEAIAELEARYRRVGGRTPLLAITREQARLLEERLRAEGLPAQVYVG